jgi:hypothetical protein
MGGGLIHWVRATHPPQSERNDQGVGFDWERGGYRRPVRASGAHMCSSASSRVASSGWALICTKQVDRRTGPRANRAQPALGQNPVQTPGGLVCLLVVLWQEAKRPMRRPTCGLQLG